MKENQGTLYKMSIKIENKIFVSWVSNMPRDQKSFNRYNEQAQLIILNILLYFELEKEQVNNGIPIHTENVIQRAADATKLSPTTICNIRKNGVKFLF